MEFSMKRKKGKSKIRTAERNLRPKRQGPSRLKLRDKVEAALKRLASRNRTARQTKVVRHRYDYLHRSYRLSGKFEGHRQTEQIARFLGWKGKGVPDQSWFIGRILRRTSKDDRRLRSKHAAALRYASARGIPEKGLIAFVQKKGGFNKCAERLRRRRRKAQC
jgi:hypothetical protein